MSNTTLGKPYEPMMTDAELAEYERKEQEAFAFRQTLRVGMTVLVDSPKFPGPWVVEKINPKSVALTQGPRRLRADAYSLKPLPEGQTATLLGKAVEVPIPEFFDIGQPVAMRGKEGVYVVIKQGEKINVSKLGGEGGRYWRCAPQSLTKLSLSEVAKLLS